MLEIASGMKINACHRLESVEDGSVPDVDPVLDDDLQNYDSGDADCEQPRVAGRAAAPETQRAIPESAKEIFSPCLFLTTGSSIFGHIVRRGSERAK